MGRGSGCKRKLSLGRKNRGQSKSKSMIPVICISCMRTNYFGFMLGRRCYKKYNPEKILHASYDRSISRLVTRSNMPCNILDRAHLWPVPLDAHAEYPQYSTSHTVHSNTLQMITIGYRMFLRLFLAKYSRGLL